MQALGGSDSIVKTPMKNSCPSNLNREKEWPIAVHAFACAVLLSFVCALDQVMVTFMCICSFVNWVLSGLK